MKTKPLSLFLAFAVLATVAPAADKPVKVYVLSGQSNMVGIGQVSSGGVRWGDEFQNPLLSVYEGAYDPKVDYDSLKPTQTLELASFGGTRPTEYPKGGKTRDFFPKAENSPRNQGFHYHQNAGTYMQIGEAMGEGMLELLKK